jgi:hypothetical protein
MKEMVGGKLGNFIGEFLEYDKNNNSCFWRQYMRLRIKLDVRVPLKRDTKVKDRNGNWCTVKFKYEKLGIFCFVCGIMGHAENRCETRFAMEVDDGRRDWSNELRAEPRRMAGRPKSRWLVEEQGSGQKNIGGGASVNNGQRQFSGESSMQGPTSIKESNIVFNNTLISSHNSPINHSNPVQNPVSQTLIPQHSQSLPHNGTIKKIPHVTSSTANLSTSEPVTNPLLLPANPAFNASAKSLSQNAMSASTHVNSDKSPATIEFTSVHSLKNHYQSLNRSSLAKPILTPILISDPTNKTKAPLPTHKVTTQPVLEKKIDHKKLPTQIAPGTQFSPDYLTNHVPLPFPLNVADDTGSVDNMDIQFERKRRREEENKKESTSVDINQHFLSAGPGSQDCREQ